MRLPGAPERLSGWWDAAAMPRLVDVVLSDRTVGPWREQAYAGVSGTVLEVGFGSGLSLPFYGEEVTRVLAAEPSDLAWERSAERRSAFGRPVERVAVDAARLPLPDGGVDAAVASWALCTVPDLPGALAEVARVLRPGGALHAVEHSRAPDAPTARAQRLLQPAWGPLAGGCHLDRDVPAALRAAGYAVDVRREAYAVPWWPARVAGWFVVVTAQRPNMRDIIPPLGAASA
ncbi:MAG TPA: methyltransferase domain-containing protein [Dermatophilaceae bacterium]|nr:methyltransferase domain-containing protein [Dermatophilaceae bacterium]